MKESVTQELDYGCAIACIAFAMGVPYQDAAVLVGKKQANSSRFYVKDLLAFLNSTEGQYKSFHVKSKNRKHIYAEGLIVLIRSSKRYPTGHYLIRHEGKWMDPWINMPHEKDISKAKSGYRSRLPGNPMYGILKIS